MQGRYKIIRFHATIYNNDKFVCANYTCAPQPHALPSPLPHDRATALRLGLNARPVASSPPNHSPPSLCGARSPFTVSDLGHSVCFLSLASGPPRVVGRVAQ